MAPKGGKGGGGGSSGGSGRGRGSSSCASCNDPITLAGYDWQNGRVTGLFVVQILTALVLVVALIIASRFRWTRENGRDRLRNLGFKTATLLALFSYIIVLVDTGLRENSTDTTRLYYLILIFNSFFWRLADVIIIAVILRTNAESVSGVFRKIESLHKLIVVVLGILQAVAFGLYTAITVQLIQGYSSAYSSSRGSLNRQLGYVMLGYAAILFVTSIMAGGQAVWNLLKDRSKPTLIMLALVIPSFFLYALIRLIFYAIYYSPSSLAYNSTNLTDLSWAYSFISDFMTMGIYLGLALVGWLYAKRGGSSTPFVSNKDSTAYNSGVPQNYAPPPEQNAYQNQNGGWYGQQQQQQQPYGR